MSSPYYPEFKFKVPSPLPPSPEIVAGRVVAFVVIVALATWGMSQYLRKRQGQAIVAPQYMTVRQKEVYPMMFMEKSSQSKPLSTPTTLGSKYGLGGGPLVGSQSLRLGGSTFLPGRNVTSHGDAQYDERPPFNVTWSNAASSSSNFAPPMTSRLPGRKVVDSGKPVSSVTPAVVAPPSPAVPLVDEVIATNAEVLPVAPTAPVVLAAAPFSSSKVRGSYFVGAPTSPNQIPEGIMVDTRDGKIIQPR